MAEQIFRIEFRAMASSCEIVAVADNPALAQTAMAAAMHEVMRIERKYSRYRTDEESIVHRINRAAGSPEFIPCDPETSELLNFAEKLFEKSDGLFDITSGILRRAWDFSKPEIPSPAQLEPLCALIGWDKVERSGDAIRLRLKDMEIDFGGFGKEYAVDRATKVLINNDISNGYVNLGGDIRALGPKPSGEPWLFGVQNPAKPGTAMAEIPISTGALCTSGDYEKYVEIDGKRYSHILNPRSGFPVKCWRSVSIVGVTAVAAGGYATIAMLKERSALAFLQASNCGYFLIDLAGRTFSHTQLET